jgi:hypothetical protein
MGQNSTEVAYGFGQLGSVFTNLAKPVFPPKDHVIVAIQFLAENTPTIMLTETLDTFGPQFPGTDDTEATAANYLGVTEAAAASATSAGVVTIADVAANAAIKKGQFVIIGADADTIDAGITLDTSAGHVDPVYTGPNKQGLVVENLTGGTYGTTLTITDIDGGVVDLSGIDASNTLYFLDEQHAVGGTTTESVAFPAGSTIYGRWTKFVGENAKGVICYFGK